MVSPTALQLIVQYYKFGLTIQNNIKHQYLFRSIKEILTTCRVPTNCRFEIDDVEEPWTYKNEFDFIHARDFLFSIKDWEKLVNQCYEYAGLSHPMEKFRFER
jgi:hypothetical protein